MSSCNQSECGKSEACAGCASNPKNKQPETEKVLPNNIIKKVIGVVSGKGGVGKSMTTAMLAVMLSRKGYKVGILDGDITGPSIPKMFGIKGRAMGSEEGILPRITASGIKIMSVNLLLDNEETPVIWRGPVLSGIINQFWSEVVWGELDVLLIDMPPGTGDVPLTVFQSIPLDGIAVVTSPQELVSMIVKKAYNMAEQMNINVLGLIENMSYMLCPDCGEKVYCFGKGKTEEVAEELGVPLLGSIPIKPEIASLSDSGDIEKADVPEYSQVVESLEKVLFEL